MAADTDYQYPIKPLDVAREFDSMSNGNGSFFFDFSREGSLPEKLEFSNGSQIYFGDDTYGGDEIREFFSKISKTTLSSHIPKLLTVFGFAGVGKTYLTIHEAALNGINVLLVDARVTMNQLEIEAIFEKARARQPCIILLREGGDILWNFPDVDGHTRPTRTLESARFSVEFSRLKIEDRVWIVATTWRSLREPNVYFVEHMERSGMMVMVPSFSPKAFRTKFVRLLISRCIKVEPSRISNNAVEWIVRHSEHATFRTILNFVNRAINYVISTAPSRDHINNEILFQDRNLTDAIRACLFNHKARTSAGCMDEYTINKIPEAEAQLRSWDTDFRENAARHNVMCVPAKYLNQPNYSYKPASAISWESTESVSPVRTKSLTNSLSPELEDKISRVLGSPHVCQDLVMSRNVPTVFTCPTSPTPQVLEETSAIETQSPLIEENSGPSHTQDYIISPPRSCPSPKRKNSDAPKPQKRQKRVPRIKLQSLYS